MKPSKTFREDISLVDLAITHRHLKHDTLKGPKRLETTDLILPI